MFISQPSRCGARPMWKQGSAASPGILCCLMTSESFGCHDLSRHRWGGSAGEESCCLGLSEGADPVTAVTARRRLDALRDGGVLLDESWVYCG